MPYLVDSDVIISALGGRHQTVEALGRLADEGLAVSIISIGEIYEGAFSSVNPQAHLRTLRQFLGPYKRLPLTDPIMERFGEIRANLRRQGNLITDFDLLIGTTALHYDLTVLTYNQSHFMRIPELRVAQPE